MLQATLHFLVSRSYLLSNTKPKVTLNFAGAGNWTSLMHVLQSRRNDNTYFLQKEKSKQMDNKQELNVMIEELEVRLETSTTACPSPTGCQACWCAL